MKACAPTSSGRRQPEQHLCCWNTRTAPHRFADVGRSTAPSVLSAGIGGVAGCLDAGDGAGLVVVRGVAGDADGADDPALGVAPPHAARPRTAPTPRPALRP